MKVNPVLKTALGEYRVIAVKDTVAGYVAICEPVVLKPNIPRDFQRRSFVISYEQYKNFKEALSEGESHE
jgi:hypothetical protein